MSNRPSRGKGDGLVYKTKDRPAANLNANVPGLQVSCVCLDSLRNTVLSANHFKLVIAANVYFMRVLFRMPPVPKNNKPVNASNGNGDAVSGSSGGGSAAATCSGPMEPVRCTVATLVAEPPQIFVAVIL